MKDYGEGVKTLYEFLDKNSAERLERADESALISAFEEALRREVQREIGRAPASPRDVRLLFDQAFKSAKDPKKIAINRLLHEGGLVEKILLDAGNRAVYNKSLNQPNGGNSANTKKIPNKIQNILKDKVTKFSSSRFYDEFYNDCVNLAMGEGFKDSEAQFYVWAYLFEERKIHDINASFLEDVASEKEELAQNLAAAENNRKKTAVELKTAQDERAKAATELKAAQEDRSRVANELKTTQAERVKVETERKSIEKEKERLANELKAAQDAQKKLENEIKAAHEKQTKAEKVTEDAMLMKRELEKEKASVATVVATHEQKRLEAEMARDNAIEDRDNAVAIARKEVEDEMAAATDARQKAEEAQKEADKITKEAEGALEKQKAAEKSRRRAIISATLIVAIATTLSICFLYLSAIDKMHAEDATNALASYKKTFDDNLVDAIATETAIAKESIRKAEERELDAAVAVAAASDAHQKALEKQEAADRAFTNAMEEQKKVNESREQLLKEREDVGKRGASAARETAIALEKQRIADEARADYEAAREAAESAKIEYLKKIAEAVPPPNGTLNPAGNGETLEISHLGIRVAANNGDGVRITQVVEGSAGHQANLQPGDVIHKIDDETMTSLQNCSDAIRAAGEIIHLHVIAVNGTKRIIPFVLPPVQQGME